jgi:hypothetical protein
MLNFALIVNNRKKNNEFSRAGRVPQSHQHHGSVHCKALGSFGQNLNLVSGLARALGSFGHRCALYRRSGSFGQTTLASQTLGFVRPAPAILNAIILFSTRTSAVA